MNIHSIKEFFASYLMQKYVGLVYYWPRSRHMYHLYKCVIKDDNIPQLTNTEIKDIKSYWKRFGINPDLNCYRYYYYKTDIHDCRFVQDSIFQTKIEDYFIDQYIASKMDDKNMYDVYFKDSGFILPKTVIHKIRGSYFDDKYKNITIDNAIKRCLGEGHDLIIKKAVDSLGGHGINFYRVNEDVAKLKSILNSGNDFIVQQVITQHPFYKSINPTSLNTMRIMSLIFKDHIYIISSVLRMGAPQSMVDNFSSGGYICGINEEGKLRKYGYKGDGSKYTQHPLGFVYEGKSLPGYEKCVALIKKNAYRFLNISKLIAWDFSVDCDENPVLIEVNLSHVHVQLNQLANGPIFGEKTEEFLNEVL